MKLLENYFTDSEKEALVEYIQQAENKTSGEVRVYFERSCKEQDPQERALKAFKKLEMHKTELKNGILFYIAFDDHKYAVIGDEGIHKHVTQSFWDKISAEMKSHFKNEDFINGLKAGIFQVGEQLKKHYPVAKDDINELPDDIYFDED